MTDYATKYPKLSFDYPADRVLRIIFDRPETYNSVDAETHTQMTDIWIDIDRDQDINAVIVTGRGKAFSAGGDFSLIEGITGNFDTVMKTWKEAKDLVESAPANVKEGVPQDEADESTAPRPVRALLWVSLPIFPSRANALKSLMATRGWVSLPAIAPRSSGLCCAVWPKPNTTS